MKFRITKSPKMQVGGVARQQWNDAHQGVMSTPAWDHDRSRSNAGVTGVQQEFADWSSGKAGPLMQKLVQAPNGISPVDNWEGYQTGAYKYMPLEIRTERNGNITSSRNFGTDYEAGIAYNNSLQNPQPQQWQSNDQRIPISQAQPYQAPVYGKRPQQSNWYTDEPVDYSIDSVRTAKWGGALPGSHGTVLDTRWNPTSYQGSPNVNPKPYPYQTKRTLPEAEPGTGDIEAEKQEMVIGDFNGDDTPALMNVGGPSHAEGGKEVEVPDNSFVFSDTAKLKIKDPEILRQFGETNSKTPAGIAKKYDLQKYTAQVQDPKTDNTTRKTAQLMIANYLQKLQALASVQENLKAAKGLSNPQEQMNMGQEPQVSKYGGVPKYQSGGQSGSDYIPYSPILARAQGYDGRYGHTTKGYQRFINEQDPRASIREDGMMGEVTSNWENPTMANKFRSGEGTFRFDQEPVDVTSQYNVPYMNQPTNQQADNTPAASGIGAVATQSADNTGAYNTNNKQFTRPDQLALLNSAVNYAGIHKYLPYEPPVTGVIPETVFMDPRRALAANSEAANAQGNLAAQSGNGRSAMASYLALQGQAGKGAADIVGNYQNSNVQIANSANQNAANITNHLLEQQRERLKSLHQGNTIAAQQYDNEERKARGEVLNTYTDAWKNRATYQNANAGAQHYQIDPRTGFINFRSPDEKEAYIKILNSQAAGTGFKSPEDIRNYYTSHGVGDEELIKQAQDDWVREHYGFRDRTKVTNKAGKKEVTHTSYGQKFGGQVNSLSKFMK